MLASLDAESTDDKILDDRGGKEGQRVRGGNPAKRQPDCRDLASRLTSAVGDGVGGQFVRSIKSRCPMFVDVTLAADTKREGGRTLGDLFSQRVTQGLS